MAIAMAETSYTEDLSRLAYYADSKGYAQAYELKEKIINKVGREIENERLETQDRLIRILRIVYKDNFSRFEKDIARVALLNLESTEGLNMAQCFVYAIWKEYKMESDTNFLEEFKQRWRVSAKKWYL